MKRTADRLFGDQYQWSVLGAGRNQMPIAAQSAVMGGNVRVGLEDSLWIGPGELAEQCRAGARRAAILEGLGLEVATPDEAREILELKGRDGRRVLTGDPASVCGVARRALRRRSHAMLGRGKPTGLDRLDERRDRSLDTVTAGHEVADEAHRLAGVNAEHVVEHQHLAGAAGPGADADRRDRKLGGQRRRKRGRHHFEHQQRAPASASRRASSPSSCADSSVLPCTL